MNIVIIVIIVTMSIIIFAPIISYNSSILCCEIDINKPFHSQCPLEMDCPQCSDDVMCAKIIIHYSYSEYGSGWVPRCEKCYTTIYAAALAKYYHIIRRYIVIRDRTIMNIMPAICPILLHEKLKYQDRH